LGGKIRWSTDGWRTLYDTATWDTGLGVHVADVCTATLPAGGMVHFTFYWPAADRWEQTNFIVTVA
jgi:glucoamylase